MTELSIEDLDTIAAGHYNLEPNAPPGPPGFYLIPRSEWPNLPALNPAPWWLVPRPIVWRA
jgi:hypothetical protein